MFYDKSIKGRYVDIRSATIDDAEFTRNIRRDPRFRGCFPKLDNTIEQQRAWIDSQIKSPNDYFFVVCNKNGNSLGTISIYNIKGQIAESGRVAIKGDGLQNIEATFLNYKFAFEHLKIDEIEGWVYESNKRVVKYNEQFGGVIYPPETNSSGDVMVRVSLKKSDFEKKSKNIERFLYS